MRLKVVDERSEPITEPYVVRLWGWSIERYLEEAPETTLCEFVRGEVIMYSPVSAEHQRIVLFLSRLLASYCEARGYGEVFVAPGALRVLPDVVREPDIFVLLQEETKRAKGVPIEAKPCLVVEVTSPWTRSIDLLEKAQDYEEAQIPEYWVVDKERGEVLAHRLSCGRYEVERLLEGRLESLSLQGFWIDVRWLFSEPLPPASKCLQEILGR